MNTIRQIPLIIVVIIVGFYVNSFKQVQATLGQAKHMISKVKPENRRVELFRNGKSTLVGEEAELYPGDSLKSPVGVKVRILCFSGKEEAVPAGVRTGINNICGRVDIPHPTRPLRGIRGDEDVDIPYVISPRATELLIKKPWLIWHEATETMFFEVTVRGEGLNWTSPKLNREQVCKDNICKISYPGVPELKPEIDYKLVVTSTDTGRSSKEERTPGLGFKLIGIQKAHEVQAIIQELEKNEDLSEVTKALFLSNIYSVYNLKVEAIERLESIFDDKKNGYTFRLLGDLYQDIGLIRKAEVYYSKAITILETHTNMHELAAAKFGLGKIKYALNKKSEAIQLLEETRELYTQLQYDERIEEVKKQLLEINE